jgi:hypothetical protein|tara:strand:+ start:66 stop:512 length:447 start_codon:yes stop_codon:yes gene_type:complete
MFNFFKKKQKKDIPDLVFKSNQHAFKYAMEFFKDVPLTKEEAVHGLVTKVIGENYFAKAFCYENNKTVETLVFATLHPECKSTISSGDLVLVGIEQVGKIITREELRKHEGEKGEIFKDAIEDCPKGFILYKLKPILDVKTKKFLIDE